MIVSRPAVGVALNAGVLGSAIVLSPEGVKNNRDGVGTIFELLAGPRYQRRDGDGRPVHFGLGEDARIDAVRVLWPSGIRQAVIEAVPGSTVHVKERAGLVGSCPFLYAWNGEKFEYITDILTVTPLGEQYFGIPSDIPGKGNGTMNVIDFGSFPGNSPELGVMLITNGDRGTGARGGATQETEALLFEAK